MTTILDLTTEFILLSYDLYLQSCHPYLEKKHGFTQTRVIKLKKNGHFLLNSYFRTYPLHENQYCSEILLAFKRDVISC